jgi:nitronate monooxygenase
MFEVPLIVAPMAGGTSTPALVTAAGAAGAVGFLAAGYKTPQAVAAEIASVRPAGVGFGVNLFVPSGAPADAAALAAYRAELQAEADRYGVELPELTEGITDDADFFSEKVQLLCDDPVPMVSFTFGLPAPAQVRVLQRAGTAVLATVTSVTEADAAAAIGVDALVLQHASAGGHSGAFLAGGPAPARNAAELVGQVRRAGIVLPLAAAGGISDAASIAAVLAAGASAAQLGTAFIRCAQSGARQLYKDALADPAYTRTALTLAFTGKPARALENRFVLAHPDAPRAYPGVHYLTAPIRAGAAAAGDSGGLNLWAGTGWRTASDGSAESIIGSLLGGL